LRLEVGSVLKQYRIGPLPGRGGMGEVYSAEDTKLGRKVFGTFQRFPAACANGAKLPER
jgi:hypothetical protein